MLTQTIDGKDRVLSYASRTLTPAERNYSVTERECLVVLWAVRKFRPYVEGYTFKVITDHSNLKWLCNLKNPTGRLARWALELQGYEYKIEHRKGSFNCVPDALSRMYEDEDHVELFSLQTGVETQDAWYKRMYASAQSDPTGNPYLKVVAGRLYHYRSDPSNEDLLVDQDAWKLVVPNEQREQILQECHDELVAGHLGRHRTYERVALYYYRPTLHKDVTQYVEN